MRSWAGGAGREVEGRVGSSEGVAGVGAVPEGSVIGFTADEVGVAFAAAGQGDAAAVQHPAPPRERGALGGQYARAHTTSIRALPPPAQ